MSDSMFQKEFSDEISVRDLDIANPCPGRLDVRFNPDGQVFFATPGVVLKRIYSSMDSLAAFSSDEDVNVYVCYSRDSHGKDKIFIGHIQSPSGETLSTHTIDELPYEIQNQVPGDFR